MPSRLTMLLTLAGAACASAGTPLPEAVSRVNVSAAGGVLAGAEIHNTPGMVARTVPAPVDSVWPALPRVYEMLGIAEAGADPARKVFGALEFRPRRIEDKRLSTYIDCGMGVTAVPKADAYQVTMSVLTQLTPADGGGTVVATLVEATGKPRGVSGNPVYCQSNGVLETRVAELVLWVLASRR
jgi:hypothetical protein